jgi:hypothetical protein
MIEQGKAQPEEICFMCSEFLIFRCNGKDCLVQSGDPRYLYQIDSDSLRASYEDGTVTLKGYSPIRPKSVGVFAYYFNLYDAFVELSRDCIGIRCRSGTLRRLGRYPFGS